mgnify:CR=1 FL=1
MEVHPGVFVSSTATEDWEQDPEVGGEMHVLVSEEGAFAGMSRYRERPDGEAWTLPERETLLILEGSARVEIVGGPTLDLRVGDMASIHCCTEKRMRALVLASPSTDSAIFTSVRESSRDICAV